MLQAIRRRRLTAEDRFQSQASPCGIYGGQSDTGTDFLPRTSVFFLLMSFFRCSMLIFIVILQLCEGEEPFVSGYFVIVSFDLNKGLVLTRGLEGVELRYISPCVIMASLAL
jgi:hypothetical protein